MTGTHIERGERCENALRRFAGWFDQYRRPDGSLDAPDLGCSAYMPVPVYAHVTGDADLLHRTLFYIEKRVAADESFLRPAGKGLLPYRAAWMLMGAAFGEHWSLAAGLERWMLRFQHRASGGIFGGEAVREAGEGEICFDSTATVCAALCLSGNVAEAERAGEFLRQLVQAQPEPARRFLAGWDTKKGFVRQFDPQEARAYVIEWEQPKQFLYKIGLLVRAFALLHARTGRPEWLELAERMQRMAVTSSPDVWSNTLAHKLAWSAYTLYLVTRNADHAGDVCRMADRLVELQQADGAFHYPEFWPPYEQVAIEQKFNIGCQFATWISYARTLLHLTEHTHE